MKLFISAVFCFLTTLSYGQIDEDQNGAWYMYLFKTNINESNWGIQGDLQHRNWNVGGDLEQLLLRGGVTYSPDKSDVLLTLGGGRITTGQFGESDNTTSEYRVYQEVLYSVKLSSRIHSNHRFRYEQRWVEGQSMRTRFRYNLFINIPLNEKEMIQGTFYLALYNELFVNGEREIGPEEVVELFDRNRTYVAAGYVIKSGLKIQVGAMKQTTDNWAKNQLQISTHHTF